MDELTREFPLSDEAIRRQLDRILGHEEFHATEKMRDFLRFVVEQTLAGNAQHIKGFTIATEVFNRDEDFDPAHDPVVRIQAGRLRRAMERYYLVAGGRDPIRIEIPKGGYVPEFTVVPAPEPAPTTASGKSLEPPESWPTVVVLPFEDMTGNTDLAYLGAGLTMELCIELGRCNDLRVMLYRDAVPGTRTAENTPDFTVRGSIRADGSAVKVVVQLIETISGAQVWADWLKSDLNGAELISFQERMAARIAVYIAGEQGAIARTLSRDPIAQTSAVYRAILKGYAYLHTTAAESYLQAFEDLQLARERDAECGLVCSMLALLYVDNISLEFFDPERTPLAAATDLAHEGALTLPDSQFSRLVLARTHLLADELERARGEVEAARALHPESLLFMDAIGYLLLLLGDWERGERLVRTAIERNPYYRVYARYGTWLNCFRQEDYDGALAETECLLGTGFFWDPLVRAATLGQLGRDRDGRRAVQELLALKPDFPDRWRILIGHYVKFPGIVDRIVAGLARSGLFLES